MSLSQLSLTVSTSPVSALTPGWPVEAFISESQADQCRRTRLPRRGARSTALRRQTPTFGVRRIRAATKSAVAELPAHVVRCVARRIAAVHRLTIYHRTARLGDGRKIIAASVRRTLSKRRGEIIPRVRFRRDLGAEAILEVVGALRQQPASGRPLVRMPPN